MLDSAAPPPPGSRPLEGVRVLDLTRVLSGPHSTRMLLDLGAEIIKVEPPAGDTTRFSMPRINGVATYFAQQNVGKRNISLDLNKREALQILLDIAEISDVVVENFRPGVAERMGLGYDAIAARNPRIVYASISGYGQDGPWVQRRAYAPVVQAEVGYATLQARGRGGVAANDSFSHADVYTGMECCTAILAALFQRERTGRGDKIDVSMAQSMLYANEHVHDELWDGEIDPNWIRSFGSAESPVLIAANGEEVIIAGHPLENGIFTKLMIAAGRGELNDDPRMASIASRRQHFVEIDGIIRDWAATMPNAEAVEAALSIHKLATGRLRSVREICDTDWAAARDAVVTTSDRGGGTFRIPNAPWRFAGSKIGITGNVRYRGEDNHEVLAELLHLDDEQLKQLDADGVLSSRVPDNATP
ncbi:MAG: CaiB/BaiF CoA-transferase family protein [Ilumatobacteraceae bacterium]